MNMGMGKKQCLAWIAFLACALAAAGCAAKEEALTGPRADELHGYAESLASLVSQGRYEEAEKMMSQDLLSALDGGLAAAWEGVSQPLGAYQGTGGWAGTQREGYEAIEMTLAFEKGTLIQRSVFDSSNYVIGIFYRSGSIGEK
jgi:hypothetical protein